MLAGEYHIQNFIDNNWVDAQSQQCISFINPATNKIIDTQPDSSVEDLEKAVISAQKAFPIWKNFSLQQRGDILNKIANNIEKYSENLALAETMNNGKPISLSKKVDIPRAASNMRFFANAIQSFSSQSHDSQTHINYTLRQPVGIVACISPWNLPLYLFTWKIAPALASGNCVIAKPSEITPLTAHLFSKICVESGLPSGVLNILYGHGAGIGEAIVSHKEIKAISFTGGTATGKKIACIAAPMFKKLSLELGGKNPNIIFDDANIEQAVKTSIHSSFSNQGQICLCGSRIYVHENVYELFKKNFIESAKKLRIGNPLHDATQIGAVVSKAHYLKILSYINLAKQEGASILLGGDAAILQDENAEGFFINPTILEGLTNDCRTIQEEIFGPVVSLTPFKTEAEAIALSNDTQYGLSATIWTENVSKAHRVAAALDCGIVWINDWLIRDLRTPFGGTKQSGVGREGGEEALRFFTEPKNICVKIV